MVLHAVFYRLFFNIVVTLTSMRAGLPYMVTLRHALGLPTPPLGLPHPALPWKLYYFIAAESCR